MPKFDETMMPILKVLYKQNDVGLRDVADILKKEFFVLTEMEEKELVSNGNTRFYDRVAWGRTYLKKAGLLEQKERGGNLFITEEGRKMVNSGVDNINITDLEKYESFKNFKYTGKKNENEESIDVIDNNKLSPQDLVDLGFQKVLNTLKSDLLEKLIKTNPYYFEKVILILFQKMGYGDFQETPKSGDGGVDGIISQDKLGLEKIYVQAKRYSENKVREPEIRNFIGAMSGDVNKGIFVTTTSFDDNAILKAKNAYNHKIILIDGEELTNLMIKYNVGVQIQSSYEIKEVDNDFFEIVGN